MHDINAIDSSRAAEALRLQKDAQEAPARLTCRLCGGEIYEYEEYYRLNGDTFCASCIEYSREAP